MRTIPMQRVLFVVAAVAAVAIYLIWWVTYAGIHYIPRYTVRPPGTAVEVQRTSVRLLSLIRADQLINAEEDKPGLPDPGTVWIVAEFEAERLLLRHAADGSAAATPVLTPPLLADEKRVRSLLLSTAARDFPTLAAVRPIAPEAALPRQRRAPIPHQAAERT